MQTISRISDNTAGRTLRIVDNLAYLANYGNGLKIYDISTPSAPKLLDQFNTNLNNGAGRGDMFSVAFGVYSY